MTSGPLKFSKNAIYLSSFMIFLVAVIEIKIILKEFHKNGYFYYPHLLGGCFITFNAIGNLIYCYKNDSVVVNSLKPSQDANELRNWRYCEKCLILAPPRSWHCTMCEACILKRDHHCVIIGRCVGHRNYRYFLVFLVYAVIGTYYAGYLNTVYVFWCNTNFFDNFFLKICFMNPLLLPLKYFWDMEPKSLVNSSALLLVFSFLFTSGVFVNILLFEHSKRFLIGATSHEGQKTLYNTGSWYRNLEMVLGKNYILVWLAPFFRSALPHDGINWDPPNVRSEKN